MAKVTNTAKGARGIRTKDGDLVMVEPGQSVSGDFDAAEVRDFNAMVKADAPARVNEVDVDEASAANPLDQGVAGLKTHLAGVDDIDALKQLGKDEAAGANRTTALDAIQARIAELEAPKA